jgi:1,4-alpha-glucan branching enzyme
MKRIQNRGATMAMPMSLRHNPKTDVEGSGRRIEIELTCEAPQAESVFVVGNFNRWRAGDLRLRRDETGIWKVQLWLLPGRYEYRFIVDGEWQDDTHAPIRVPNEFGSNNCVLEVQARSDSDSLSV